MKIVVIGGTGLIGSKTVTRLREQGHQVVAASPSSGVNTLTGEELTEALAGAEVVVDVANSPSFEDQAVMEFFQTAGRNLLAAEVAAGVRHHVALSIVGTDRLPESGYMRAKVAQEALIEASPVPYTIVRATQFFEFLPMILQWMTRDDSVHLSADSFQPILSDDVVTLLTEYTLGAPVNGHIEIAGPDRWGLDEFGRKYLEAKGDSRMVVTDPTVNYFGATLSPDSLVPTGEARLGRHRFEEWLKG